MLGEQTFAKLRAGLREINTTKPQQAKKKKKKKKKKSAPNGQPQLKPRTKTKTNNNKSQTNNNIIVKKIKQINKKAGMCGVQPLANPGRGILEIDGKTN